MNFLRKKSVGGFVLWDYSEEMSKMTKMSSSPKFQIRD